MGGQPDFDYDSVAELTFDDVSAFQAFMAILSQGEAAKKFAEDEEMFLDRPRTTAVVVDEINETTRNVTKF